MKVVGLTPVEDIRELWTPIFEGLMMIDAGEIIKAFPSGVPNYNPPGYPFTILDMELRGLVYVIILDKRLHVGTLEGYIEQKPLQVAGPRQQLQMPFKMIINRQSYLDTITLVKLDKKVEEEGNIGMTFDNLSIAVRYFRPQPHPQEGFIIKRASLKIQVRLVDWLAPLTAIEGYRAVLISNNTYQKLKELAKRMELPSHLTIDDILVRILEKLEESRNS